MKKMRISGLGLLTTIALAGCSDANGPNTDDALDADVAMVAADAALEDIQAMNSGFGGFGSSPAMFSAGPPTERSRTVTFFDAGGNAQDGYNAETTASINVVSDMSGSVTRDTWTATIERHRDMTITGLLETETSRTWNGTGDGSVQRSRHSDESGDRSYDMSSTSVIADVVRGLPRADNPYPLSGTITRTISITIVNGPNGDETRSRTVVITFNGTQFATLTINGGDSVDVDLAAREGRHPIRGRGR